MISEAKTLLKNMIKIGMLRWKRRKPESIQASRHIFRLVKITNFLEKLLQNWTLLIKVQIEKRLHRLLRLSRSWERLIFRSDQRLQFQICTLLLTVQSITWILMMSLNLRRLTIKLRSPPLMSSMGMIQLFTQVLLKMLWLSIMWRDRWCLSSKSSSRV